MFLVMLQEKFEIDPALGSESVKNGFDDREIYFISKCYRDRVQTNELLSWHANS